MNKINRRIEQKRGKYLANTRKYEKFYLKCFFFHELGTDVRLEKRRFSFNVDIVFVRVQCSDSGDECRMSSERIVLLSILI